MFEFIFKTQQFSTFVKNFNPLEPDFVFMGCRKATPGSNELMYNLISFSDLPPSQNFKLLRKTLYQNYAQNYAFSRI